jgi:hypothetical protein
MPSRHKWEFISALDGGEWLVSRSSHFTLGERAPDSHWIGDWVGPRAGLEAVEKRIALSPAGNRTQGLQALARRYSV